MSNANQETIEDIVADIRAQNQGLPEDSYALSPLVCDLLSLADRIEAAAKHHFREATKMILDDKNLLHLCNAAKMREALSDACYAMFNFLKTQNGGYEEMANALDKAKAALAEPPRNCDIGNALEQYARVRAFCKKHKVGLRCVGCPVNGVLPKNCALIWAQMPYDEAKGERATNG